MLYHDHVFHDGLMYLESGTWLAPEGASRARRVGKINQVHATIYSKGIGVAPLAYREIKI